MSDKDRNHRRDANRPRPALTFDRILKAAKAAKAMKDEPSNDESKKKPCRGLFCGLFGGKRRTKKRRKKRRTKSRRKTKRRRKSRRRTKRRRRKR